MFLALWEVPPTDVWCAVGDMENKGWYSLEGNWVLSHVALWSKEGEVYILYFVWLAANAIVSKEELHDHISFFDI